MEIPRVPGNLADTTLVTTHRTIQTNRWFDGFGGTRFMFVDESTKIVHLRLQCDLFIVELDGRALRTTFSTLEAALDAIGDES